MIRFLIFFLGMLTTRAGDARSARFRADDPYRTTAPLPPPVRGADEEMWQYESEPRPPQQHDWAAGHPGLDGERRRARRRRIPLKVRWVAAIVLVALIFRKVIAWAVLVALSAALHLVGINAHLPHIKFAWPWQSISSGTTTDTAVGPWVLQKIEGISKPALGTANFTFTFTHKVSKSIGIWPCWYSATFAAVGHASATVNLNPGPAWWAPGSGHYLLRVFSRSATGQPGRVSVAIVLPRPQLPQTVHDVTIDDTLSHPIDTQHSWTYPGFGCGGLIRPQFSEAVLYSQAQGLAFSQARSNPQITRPLISAAEAQAGRIIRDNFVQPTVNALGYILADFTVRWAASS